MIRTLIVAALLVQLGPRPPLTPATTLLAPELLREIDDVGRPPSMVSPTTPIEGVDPSLGEIVLASNGSNSAVSAVQSLRNAIAAGAIPRPSRTIRLIVGEAAPSERVKAAIQFAPSNRFAVGRNLWSTASIVDEVVEIFARDWWPDVLVGSIGGSAKLESHWEAYGIPTTRIFDNGERPVSVVAAASAYFLATLPNAGSEALLSHLTVGAHARLAEDGRKAVAQMGNQQRASAEVLIMFGQAIEREQRRMQSFERFMPAPVDPMLHSRILDMQKGITSLWTSMGITSSPFVPAAERIRGRGGEDLRVPVKAKPGGIAPLEPPTAFLKFDNPGIILYELANFIDGKRSISDIRDAVSAEFGALPLPSVVDYFERLAKNGAVTFK